MSKRSRESHARIEFDEPVEDGNADSLVAGLEKDLRAERAMRLQLANDSQRHLDRALRAEATLARAQAAVAFAGRVLKEHRNNGMPDDLDGGWLQDTALELGLLDQREVFEPCSQDNCACAEVTTGWPVTCFFLSEAGTAAIRAGEETE